MYTEPNTHTIGCDNAAADRFMLETLEVQYNGACCKCTSMDIPTVINNVRTASKAGHYFFAPTDVGVGIQAQLGTHPTSSPLDSTGGLATSEEADLVLAARAVQLRHRVQDKT